MCIMMLMITLTWIVTNIHPDWINNLLAIPIQIPLDLNNLISTLRQETILSMLMMLMNVFLLTFMTMTIVYSL